MVMDKEMWMLPDIELCYINTQANFSEQTGPMFLKHMSYFAYVCKTEGIPLNFRTVAYLGLLLKGPSFRVTE